MSFNQILKTENAVLNHENAKAFKMSAEMELYTAVCASSMQPKFYESNNECVERIAKLVKQVNPIFVAQLAIYARTVMNLRSVPLLLVVELARVHSGDDLVSRTIDKVVLRADEIMELLMCYQWRNPQPGLKKLNKLSNQIKRGLQLAFNKFDEYQFAKYDRNGMEVKLRDALFLVHPKAKDEAQQLLFDKISSNTLSTPYTWETELSKLGTQHFEYPEAHQNAFRDKWSELIMSGQLGYMALLRNLRNILNAEVSTEVLQIVANRISDSHGVAHSKQFPFRYFSAYRELEDSTNPNVALIIDALEKAMQVSASNIPVFNDNENTLIACDMSGSMKAPISRNSKIKLYEVGCTLAMLLQNRCKNLRCGIFGNEWELVNFDSKNILSNVSFLNNLIGKVGYGTNGNKPLEYLINEKLVMDKVVYFTDCQFWNYYFDNHSFFNLWEEYKSIAPNAQLYLFDLAGYGHSPIDVTRRDVTIISGWNERIFDIIDSINNAEDSLEKIRSIMV